jgi:murein DD-endopeptidase MepM/ murein hydrolase activator NlpD
MTSKEQRMKIYFPVTFIILLITTGSTFQCLGGHIENDKKRWEPYYLNVSPSEEVSAWKVPFNTNDRTNLKTIRMISTFGAPRLSYVKGHFHTGIDLIPKKNNDESVYIFPMAAGSVCSIHLGDPHRTVVIKHKLPGGEILYTSYKHLQAIYVANGQHVTTNTRLGRLYTRAEAAALGGNYNHLHLEIRKQFDDFGVASWATLKKEDLDKRFHDPWMFMTKNIKKS